MIERKSINKLFQEKFENFEMSPDKMVWQNIEKKLNEKKKRRIIPFWWKLSGIAAALLTGLLIYNNDSKISLNTDNGIVNEKNNNYKISCNSANKDSEKTNKSLEPIDLNDKISKNTIAINTNKNNNQSIIVLNNDTKTNSKNEHKSVDFTITKNKVKASSIVKNNSEEKIAFQKSKSNKGRNKKSSVMSLNNSLLVVTSDFKEKTILSEDIEFNINTANNNTIEKKQSVLKNTNIKTDEAVHQNLDSIKMANVEKNTLEELQNEKEKKIIIEPKLKRWQISSNVAPIYFSSLFNGSPIDNSLKDNSKSYATNNKSYGLGINYTLNKKLKVRTGVNILIVDYNTNGIIYSQVESVSGRLANLNPNNAGSNIVIENFSNVDSPFNKITQKSEGSLNQKMGYIEMPLELTYNILNKKLGIDFIGGMSTMILNQNEIFLQSSELNLKIGEANNLNSIHFSGNIGLGLKYDVLKHFEAHFEPIFKYQINTFNNNVENFKPYLFGVYSGINFTF